MRLHSYLSRNFLSLAAMALLLMAAATSRAAVDGVADTVADWDLQNNNISGNSFGIVGNTISGTFEARPAAAGRALDLSLDPLQTNEAEFTRGRVQSDQDFAAEGTFSFSNPNGTDPFFFWGFYDEPADPSEFSKGRLFGFGLADQTPGQYRIQGFASGVELGNMVTLSDGTYRFEIRYSAGNATGTLRIEDLNGVLQGSEAVQAGYAGFEFTSFGLTQDNGADSGTHPFTLGPVEYTGGTNIPEPGTAGLLGLMSAGLLGLRRAR